MRDLHYSYITLLTFYASIALELELTTSSTNSLLLDYELQFASKARLSIGVDRIFASSAMDMRLGEIRNKYSATEYSTRGVG